MPEPERFLSATRPTVSVAGFQVLSSARQPNSESRSLTAADNHFRHWSPKLAQDELYRSCLEWEWRNADEH